MKDYVFIADDSKLAPSELDEMRRVTAELGFEKPLEYFYVEDRRNELLVKAHALAGDGNHVYLITDANFHFELIPQLGGARLGEDFLRVGGATSRIVIRSSQPLLSDGLKGNPRVLTAKRTDLISELFIFLRTGRAPAVKRCIEFLRHLDAINHLFSTSRSNSGVGVEKVIEALSQGFGCMIPEPFDGSTLDLFDSTVSGALGQGTYSDEWKGIVNAFHPFEALRSAASDEFSPCIRPGSFLVLWLICLAKTRTWSDLVGLQKSDERFAPREQEWIRRRRKEVEARIHSQYSGRTDSERWKLLVAGAGGELNTIHKFLKKRDEVGG